MYSEIASNNRRSIVFIGLFFVMWIAIGAIAGLIFTGLASRNAYNAQGLPESVKYGSSPIFVGMAICAILAIMGILFSLTSGARMVLRVSGAVPADPQQYQQLHDIVAALAIGEGIP